MGLGLLLLPWVVVLAVGVVLVGAATTLDLVVAPAVCRGGAAGAAGWVVLAAETRTGGAWVPEVSGGAMYAGVVVAGLTPAAVGPLAVVGPGSATMIPTMSPRTSVTRPRVATTMPRATQVAASTVRGAGVGSSSVLGWASWWSRVWPSEIMR